MHIDDAACFFDGAFAAIAVLIGAVIVYDDGAAGANELVHAFPGGNPRVYTEGAELPDGAFEVANERLQNFFAVDGATDDGLERRDGAADVGIVFGIAVDVNADTHVEGWTRRVLVCHPRGGGNLNINDFC